MLITAYIVKCPNLTVGFLVANKAERKSIITEIMTSHQAF